MIKTKGELRRIGDILRQGPEHPQFNQAYGTLNTYRQVFSYPMFHVGARCRQIIQKHLPTLVEEVTIAQRHKRLHSILLKLQRFEQMNLDRMVDIGGVRVILPSMEDVRKFQFNFPGKSRILIDKTKDYIAFPKEDGYRSLHLILKLENIKYPDWEAFQTVSVELQVRTYLQHCWATAVEIAGILDKRSYKTGDWDESLKSFFVLLSQCFALKETTGLNSTDIDDLMRAKLSKLKQLDQEHHFLDRLTIGAITLNEELTAYAKPVKRHEYLLIDMNFIEPGVNVYAMTKDDWSQLHPLSHELTELIYESNQAGQILLVHMQDLKNLKRAYPNFFFDTGKFIETVDELKKTYQVSW